MTYQVYELRDSESGSIDNENLEAGETWNVTKKYIIGQCPGGLGEVKDAIASYMPRYWDTAVGMWRRKGISIKGIGKQCFECTGEYTTMLPAIASSTGGAGGNGGPGGGGDTNSPEDGSQLQPGSIAWDTTGATEHITSAISERVIGGEGADDFQGAINLNGTSVQGIDKVVPAMRYSETWIMPTAVGLSEDFVKSVYTLTGTVNKSKFRAFSPGEALYEGMIIGIHSRDNDLVVNPIKGKQLTNVRASGTDEAVRLVPPMELTLEKAVEFIADDELVEITPKSIRLRKRYLKDHERRKADRQAA
jgi:hypothetical protein